MTHLGPCMHHVRVCAWQCALYLCQCVFPTRQVMHGPTPASSFCDLFGATATECHVVTLVCSASGTGGLEELESCHGLVAVGLSKSATSEASGAHAQQNALLAAGQPGIHAACVCPRAVLCLPAAQDGGSLGNQQVQGASWTTAAERGHELGVHLELITICDIGILC